MTVDDYEQWITIEAIRLEQEHGWPIEMCRISAEFMAAMLFGRPSIGKTRSFIIRRQHWKNY